MAATYTILNQDRSDQSDRINDVEIAFSAETYSSGLSVDLAKCGMRQVIKSLIVYDAVGVSASFNGGKIRLYQQGAGAGALTEVSGNQTITVKARVVGF